MKSLKLFAAIIATSFAVASCNSNEEKVENTEVEEGISGTFTADVNASKVLWTGEMVKILDLVGVKSHNGEINLESGSIVLENEQITGGEFVVDMKSIVPLDSNYGETEHTREELVGHLATNDFFLADSFPTASFVITGADSTGVMGDLTIRGNTNSEKITNVVVTKTDNGIEVSGDLSFDRQKYEVTFSSGSKDVVLKDEIDLTFKVVAQP